MTEEPERPEKHCRMGERNMAYRLEIPKHIENQIDDSWKMA